MAGNCARSDIFRFTANGRVNLIMKTQDPDTESSTIEEKCDG
jgi:hypothetical protein